MSATPTNINNGSVIAHCNSCFLTLPGLASDLRSRANLAQKLNELSPDWKNSFKLSQMRRFANSQRTSGDSTAATEGARTVQKLKRIELLLNEDRALGERAFRQYEGVANDLRALTIAIAEPARHSWNVDPLPLYKLLQSPTTEAIDSAMVSVQRIMDLAVTEPDPIDDPANWVTAKWIDNHTIIKASAVRTAVAREPDKFKTRKQPRTEKKYFLPDIEAHFGRCVK